MRKYLVVSAILAGVAATPVNAIEYVHTARGRANCVVCAPGQPANCATGQCPAPQAAAPAAAPRLEAGGPGAPAQIGSANIVDVSSTIMTPVYKQVHYFTKELAEEKYTVQEPVEYTYKENYIVHVTVPVQKTGTYQDTTYSSYPVTRTTPTCVRSYDNCGRPTYSMGERSYTTYVTEGHTVNKAYSYTDYETEQRVKTRDKIGITLRPAERSRVIETVKPATKTLVFQKIQTTYTVETSSVSEVPNAGK